MQFRRFSAAASVPDGVVVAKPRWQRLRTSARRAREISKQTRKIQLYVLIIGSFLTTAYFLYSRRAGVSEFMRPATDARIVTKSDAVPPLPVPDLKSGRDQDLLARVQMENELLYTDLQSFVCNEQIERYRGQLHSEKGHQIDTLTSRVSFENGVEHYTDIYQNKHARAAISNVSGAWSEGEFGTLLRQTRALLATQPVSLKASTDLNGEPAALYTFEVSEQDSPWNLAVKSEQYRIPFRTDVWVSKSSGRMLRIERTSTAIPPSVGISEIQWAVSLEPVEMNGKTWLLPRTGEYSVLYEHSNHREWNVMTFSDYRRYGSTVVMHF